MRTSYVCGFVMNQIGFVLLLEKNRPTWQAGRLNGVGGKVDRDEEPADAMLREWKEETRLDWSPTWHHFATQRGTDYEVAFYRARVQDPLGHYIGRRNDVGERFELHRLDSLLAHEPHRLIPNLRWLLPLAFHDPVDLVVTAVEVS